MQGQVNRYQGAEGMRETKADEPNALLAASLEMSHLVQNRVNGMLVVQFDLVNKRSFPQSFQWSVDWFDTAGMSIAYGPQHWTPERLAGSAAKTIKVVAPTPEAASWRLQVGSRDEVH
jgi:uncharacterized protein YcfL